MAANLDNVTKILNDATNGAKDLTLSEDTRKAYVDALTAFKGVINDQITSLNKLPGYGDPGGFNSAKVAKQNLIDGCDEFKKYMTNYVTYLDKMIDTVNEVHKRLIANG